MTVSDSSSSTAPTSASQSDWPPTMLPTLTLTPAQPQGVHDDHTDKDKSDHAALAEEGDLSGSGDDTFYRNDSSRLGLIGFNQSLTDINLGDDDFSVPPLSLGGPETEDEEGNEAEEAVIAANLARWSEMDKQRRKSVRRRRPVSVMPSHESTTGASGGAPPPGGILRRLSTLRRGRGAARANATPVTSSSDTASASATRIHSTTALAPVPTSPQPGLVSSGSSTPQSPVPPSSNIPTDAALVGLGIAATDHQEVDMMRQPSGLDKGKRRELDRTSSTRPRPTGSKPLVTAGPAPVRSMSLHPPPRDHRPRGRGRGRGRDRSHPLSSSPPSSSPSPSPSTSSSPSPARSPFRGGKLNDPPRERGFWLTDFLCCMSSSNDDEAQAGRTNPLE